MLVCETSGGREEDDDDGDEEVCCCLSVLLARVDFERLKNCIACEQES